MVPRTQRRLAPALRTCLPALAVAVLGTWGCSAVNRSGAVPDWPQFRGPRGTGTCPAGNYSVSWDARAGQGVRWTSPKLLPGKGSPVVAGNRVFATGADDSRRVVYCFSANSGRPLWERAVGGAATAGARDTTVGAAASSPATDGRRVFALFVDGTLVALTLIGRIAWQQQLDLSGNTYGHASSLVVHRGRLLLQIDQEHDRGQRSELAALDCATGRILWRTPREVGSSWATPVVISAGGREEIITCATPWVIAYDPGTGAELWRADCLGGEVVPSATVAGDLVVVANQGAACAAIKPGGSGDVSRTGVAWRYGDDLPDVCSPVSDGQRVFLLSSTGLLTCLSAQTGRREWSRPLGEPCGASPILAGESLYVTSELGNTFVLDAAAAGRETGHGSLPEGCQATPAFSAGQLYLRGDTHLFCISPHP